MIQNFFIPCEPPKATHQSAIRIFRGKNGGFIGKSKKGIETEKKLRYLLYEHRPVKPHTGAVSLEVDWIYPYKKSELKKNLGKKIPCTTRPDCDNLAKFFCDSLEKLKFFSKGDAQIYSLRFRKFYFQESGIKVQIVST